MKKIHKCYYLWMFVFQEVSIHSFSLFNGPISSLLSHLGLIIVSKSCLKKSGSEHSSEMSCKRYKNMEENTWVTSVLAPNSLQILRHLTPKYKVIQPSKLDRLDN